MESRVNLPNKGNRLYRAVRESNLAVVDLPVEVEIDKVTATLKDGVLEFTMPKAATAQTVRVHPKAS